MAHQPNSRLKLLFLLDILRERTDEERGLSTQEIIEALAERGIDAARKSIYRDIEVLRDAGFDIEVRREPYTVYALRDREFSIGRRQRSRPNHRQHLQHGCDAKPWKLEELLKR